MKTFNQILLGIFTAAGLASSALAEQKTAPQVEVVVNRLAYLCPIEKATAYQDGTLTVNFKQGQLSGGEPDGLTVCARKVVTPSRQSGQSAKEEFLRAQKDSWFAEAKPVDKKSLLVTDAKGCLYGVVDGDKGLQFVSMLGEDNKPLCRKPAK